jgi:signal peptidase II
MRFTRKARCFFPLVLGILLTDCATKRVAEATLAPAHVPHPVLGDFFRFTLSYNPGAAMSLSLGPYSRVGFSILAGAALLLLGLLYRRLSPGLGLPAIALALVTGGALGNAIDRLRSARGVVDFIDVGVGTTRFYIFNFADIAITLGALLLILVLGRSSGKGEHDDLSGGAA